MAVVTVRAFGALRDLVGAIGQVEAEHVAALLADFRRSHGPEFDRRMARAVVAVGDDQVAHDDTSPLQDGAVVVLLPPFAGG